VAPASDPAPTPKAAVYLTYAAADQHEIFRVAKKISRCGMSVFLDAACTRRDPELHIQNAISFADEVLILVTTTRVDSLKTRLAPAFLEGRLVWIAIATARARGIPVCGLLNGLTKKDVFEDQAIPRYIQEGKLLEMTELESHVADLLRWLPKARPKLTYQHGLRCRVCLCRGRSIPVVSRFERQLARVGIVLSLWRPTSDVADFEAAVVVLGSQPSELWEAPQLVVFLRDFVQRGKPVALLALPGAQEQPEIPNFLPPTARVEYRESDNLSFLQLVWKIVDYRQYDIDIVGMANPGIVEPKLGEPLRIFISYSHKDERLRRELETHLKLLLRQEVIAMWTDREIMPGEEWKHKIDENLESADVILFLVSADFVASDYCYDVEMNRALERHDAGEARVIPIILRDVHKWESAPFGKLQALPAHGKPVTLWTNRDEAWSDVAAGIRKVAEEIRSHKSGRSAGL
jgi:hypothetical protein